MDGTNPTYGSQTFTLYGTDGELILRVQVTYQNGHRPDFLDLIDEHFAPQPTDLPVLKCPNWGDFHDF